MRTALIVILMLALVCAFAACGNYASELKKTEISAEQITIAQKKWADSSPELLNKGKGIFVNECTACHKAFIIEKFSEKKWIHEIEDMSPKANLNPEQIKALSYFVFSYHDMKSVNK